MAEINDRYPWTRRDDEGSRPYDAFKIYLSQGSDRSQARVAREVGKSETLISGWASTHHWRERIRAYEIHMMEAATDGATEWTANARSETQALADKLRGLLSSRLDYWIARGDDPTMRWSTAAGVLIKMQEHGIAPVENSRMAAELDRVARMLETITGEAVE